MKILITGGFGYIGSRLVVNLNNEGHEIIIGSRNLTYQPNWIAQAKIVFTDWNNSLALEEICSGVDVVIHTAGMNSQDCFLDPDKALEFNGIATARLVSSAISVGVKRFIYLSSAHVYSSPLVGNISESTEPKNIHPYCTSQIFGENSILDANKSGEIEGLVLRLSNSFGFPVNTKANCWMLLVNDLCRQLVTTKKIILSSNGLQTRNFISLNNVSRVISHFLALKKDDLLDGLFNVGSDCSISVLEMASNIARCSELEFGSKVSIESLSVEQNKRNIKLKYDISKLKSTGINFRDDINEEITQTLRVCKNQYDQTC